MSKKVHKLVKTFDGPLTQEEAEKLVQKAKKH